MARVDPSIVPLIFMRFTDKFEKLDYSIGLTGPFEVTTPLQAMMQEAGAKGMGVVVQAALIPMEDLGIDSPIEGEEHGKEQDAT